MPLENSSSPRLLTIAQAADRLAVRPSTVRSWLRKGYLPKTKCGRCTRIPADAVEDFISAHTTPANSHSAHAVETVDKPTPVRT
jgi:excisionase family DNA binding protein